MVENYNHNNTKHNIANSSSSAALFTEINYLEARNSITGKNELVTSSIKKELKTLCSITLEQFNEKITAYKNVVDQINEKKLQKYLYYPVRNYDFIQFTKKMNRFSEQNTTADIIRKLAKKEELKAVERILQNSSPDVPKHTTAHIVDKNIAKAALQKAADTLKKSHQKQNLPSYLSLL